MAAFIYAELVTTIVFAGLFGLLLWPHHASQSLSSSPGIILLGPAIDGFLIAVPAALLVGLSFGGGAYVVHYVVRALLVRAGSCPWKYGQFLEAMTERLLLQRSSSGYSFMHQLLRDYLADNFANYQRKTTIS